MRRIETSILIVIMSLLTACSDVQYYAQSVRGQLDVLGRAQDIETLLANDQLSGEVRSKLRLVLQAREFASGTLDLSFNSSYTEYVDLNRTYVVQNLYAAEEFSTQLYTWCYPVIGCANYRGYFDSAMLERYRVAMDVAGYDTYVGQVTAYSTLGWFDDPVLNTFIGLPDFRLVGLIFHELAHQQLYTNGDTAFSESFATAVEQVGLEQFYSTEGDAKQLGRYRTYRLRMAELITLATHARAELDDFYQQPFSEDTKRERKERVLAQLETDYTALTQSWTGNTESPRSGQFNNARLGAIAAYNQYVPAFLNILVSHNGKFPPFYTHVRKLSELDPAEREQCLLGWNDHAHPAATQIAVMCEA